MRNIRYARDCEPEAREKKNKVYLKIETEKGNGQRLYLKVAE